MAAASKLILYAEGDPVVAEYESGADVVPLQITGFAPNVIVRVGLTVIEKLVAYKEGQLPLCNNARYSQVPPDEGTSE
jgi:hypothetical protein